MKQLNRYMANGITCVRIAGALLLLFVAPLTTLFYIVYSICGVSDAIDGWVARKTGSAGELGARLDSIADLLLYAVMVLRLLPILWERLPLAFWIAVGAVTVVRLASYGVAALKYHRFASMHTYLNKLTGFCLFFLPYLMSLEDLLLPSVGICSVAAAASLEELALHLHSGQYDPDRKSIFFARKAA